ncbi:YegS/Rv2252/BmrU family lipid kinase [soil metagenome]
MKRIYFLINPGAGADYPILSLLNTKLQKRRVTCEILVTQKSGDITKFTRRAIKAGADGVAVYGGDGSIMEAAKILYKTEIPLFLLPGGTANILVKELGIPTTIDRALDLIFTKRKKIKKIDVGLCNNIPFFLRVSIGFMADMVIDADPKLKKYLGQLAYPITAIQSLSHVNESDYVIKIDKKIIKETGISVVVANSTNVGFSGVSFIPKATVTDGTLYIFLIKNKLSTTDTITYWHGKDIHVSLAKKNQQIVRDDDVVRAQRLRFKIAADKLCVVVP